jgi:hypothetical protein
VQKLLRIFGICSYLNQKCSNNLDLWQCTTGKHSWPKDLEKLSHASKAFRDLVQQFPQDLSDFAEILNEVNDPTAQSYKNFCGAMYLAELCQPGLNLADASELQKKSNTYLHKAYHEFHPGAIRYYNQIKEAANRAGGCIKIATAGCSDKGLNNTVLSWKTACFECEKCNGYGQKQINEVIFKAALYGASKNSADITKIILDRLRATYWQSRGPSSEEIDALINFGNSWPPAREMLLIRGYTQRIKSFEQWFRKQPFYQYEMGTYPFLSFQQPLWENVQHMMWEKYYEQYQIYYHNKTQEFNYQQVLLHNLSAELSAPYGYYYYRSPPNFDFIIPYLECMGNDTSPVKFFGHLVISKWPEAFRLLGRCWIRTANEFPRQGIGELLFPSQREEFKKAQGYFQKAIQDGDIKSQLLLANILEASAENKSQLQETRRLYPTSVPTLIKLGKILIDEIPDNLDSFHPSVQNFAEFFSESYECLNEKWHSLRTGIPRYFFVIEDACYRKFDGPVSFINGLEWILADAGKNKKLQSAEEYFLDVLDKIIHNNQYAIESSSRTINKYLQSEIRGNYLEHKWGPFWDTGKLLPEADMNQWSEKDTLYTLHHFMKGKRITQRRAYNVLMIISLKRQEEEFFVEAYKSFCQTLQGEEMGITNYQLLETKAGQFKKAFPHNEEVERMFMVLPAPVNKNKRKGSSQGPGLASKRHKGDEWEGL